MTIATTSTCFGDWGAIAALQAAFCPTAKTPRWLALHLRHPLSAPPNELFGLGYARQRVYFSSPSGRAVANLKPVVWNGLPPGRIPYLGVWTDLTAGGLAGVLDISSAPLVIGTSGQIRLVAGDLAFAL